MAVEWMRIGWWHLRRLVRRRARTTGRRQGLDGAGSASQGWLVIAGIVPAWAARRG
jgi:hypothetical protein